MLFLLCLLPIERWRIFTASTLGNTDSSADNKSILSLDLETYSDIELKSCGMYKYVEGDFHILLLAYAFDDDPVQIIDLASGEEIPKEVVDAIFDDNIIKVA